MACTFETEKKERFKKSPRVYHGNDLLIFTSNKFSVAQ